MAKVRVYELARELKIESKWKVSDLILEDAKEIGVYLEESLSVES